MTKEQFLDIETKLAKWREERGLSVEDQKANFEVNYTKELLEFFEAKRDNNEYEMIDAICDMCIIAINAGHNYEPMLDVGKNLPLESLLLNALVYRDIEFSVNALHFIGYDPYKCLLETIKELETRTGKWCEKEGKWIKDLGAYSVEEAQRKIYEMDNGVCEVMWAVLEEETDTHYIFEVDFGTEIQKIKIKRWYRADYEKCKIVKNKQKM